MKFRTTKKDAMKTAIEERAIIDEMAYVQTEIGEWHHITYSCYEHIH